MRRIYGFLFVGACTLTGAAIPFAARDLASLSPARSEETAGARETRHETREVRAESLQVDLRPLEVLPDADGERVTLLLVISGNHPTGASASFTYEIVDDAGNALAAAPATSIQFVKGRVSFTQWRSISSHLGEGRYEARVRVTSVPALASADAKRASETKDEEAHAMARLPFRVTGDKIEWDATRRSE